MGSEVVRDRRGRVMPGSSLNPKGKPKGALSRSGQLRAALAEDVSAIIEQVVAQARAGDLQAARIILDRVLPPLRAESAAVMLPKLAEGTLAERGNAVLTALAAGKIGPDAALPILNGLLGVARLMEVDELAERVARLEDRAARR